MKNNKGPPVLYGIITTVITVLLVTILEISLLWNTISLVQQRNSKLISTVSI
jgi:hypothetical protein